MYCSKCGAPLPYGTYGNVKCEHCNGVTYVPTPEEKREIKRERGGKGKPKETVPDTTVSEKPSKAWYLAPILSSWLGGIIAYYALKGRDRDMAKKCLWLGIGITALYFIVGMIIGVLISIPDDGENGIPPYTSTPTPPPRTYVLFSDSFDSNVNDWPMGTAESNYATHVRGLTNGKYRWEVLAHQGVHSHISNDVEQVSDFYLTVDAQMDSGTTNSKYGVVFGRLDSDNFYDFSISDSKTFKFRMKYMGRWITLLDWTSTSAIRPSGVNRIGIAAEGSQFTFFINDQFVARSRDDRLSGGDIGLSIELDEAGDKSVFEFDNLKLTTTTPPPKIDYALKYDAIDLLPYTLEGYSTEEPPQAVEPDAEMLEIGCRNQATSAYVHLGQSMDEAGVFAMAVECDSPRHAENGINRFTYEMGKEEGIFSRDIQVYRGVNGKFGYEFDESSQESVCVIGWNWENFAFFTAYFFDGRMAEAVCLDYITNAATDIAQDLPTP